MMSYSLRLIFQGCLTACLFLMMVLACEAQKSDDRPATQFSIGHIDVDGCRRVELTTIMAHIVSRPGGTYDSVTVQRDAQALRDTGYFDEVRLRVEDDPYVPKRKIVTFVVKERPIIRGIEYQGIKSINEEDIKKGYKESKVTLSVESWFDPEEMTRAATVIEKLLAVRGRPSAVVKPTYERTASSNTIAILFTIDEGPKVQPSQNPH